MQKIMFNDKYCLTQAVLEGRKIQTRRVIKQEQKLQIRMEYGDDTKMWVYASKFYEGEVVAIAQNYNTIQRERVASVQSFCNPIYDNFANTEILKSSPGWKNKMFVSPELMPHKVKITNVKVQRLQDITGNDIIAEGVRRDSSGMYTIPYKDDIDLAFPTVKGAYAFLIDKVSGEGTWKSNPWVFAYTFELIE